MDAQDRERVERTAALARLELGEAETQALGRDFAAILADFGVLADLDVEGEEPMTVPGAERGDRSRPDEPVPSLDRGRLLANAPEARDGFYAVPRTLGGAP